jgi:hypothetical protein
VTGLMVFARERGVDAWVKGMMRRETSTSVLCLFKRKASVGSGLLYAVGKSRGLGSDEDEVGISRESTGTRVERRGGGL